MNFQKFVRCPECGGTGYNNDPLARSFGDKGPPLCNTCQGGKQITLDKWIEISEEDDERRV